MKFRRFCLFLVGVNSAFATAGVDVGSRTISFAAISFVLYLWSIRGSLKNYSELKKAYGKWTYLPLAYFFVLTVSNIVHDYGGGQPWINFSDILNYLVLPIVLIHSLNDHKAPLFGLFGVCLGGFCLAYCFYTGLGVEALPENGERLAIFGSNANELGIIECYSVFIVLSVLILKDYFNLKHYRWLLLVLLIAPIAVIIATASRVAFITLALTLVAFVILYPTSSHLGKIVVLVLGLIVIGQLYEKLSNSDLLIVERLMATKDDGNLGGREGIWKAYISEFPNSPIIGYGETGMVGVAKKTGILIKVSRTGVERAFSPHNVILETLMYGGIIGFLFMFVFFWNVFKRIFTDYKVNSNLLSLFLGILLIDQIISAQIFAAKYIWLALAYIISTNNLIANKQS